MNQLKQLRLLKEKEKKDKYANKKAKELARKAWIYLMEQGWGEISDNGFEDWYKKNK